MDYELNDGNSLEFIDGHIAELDGRIHALRNRMNTMILEKYETRNQQLLLSVMLETQTDLANFRKDLVRTSVAVMA